MGTAPVMEPRSEDEAKVILATFLRSRSEWDTARVIEALTPTGSPRDFLFTPADGRRFIVSRGRPLKLLDQVKEKIHVAHVLRRVIPKKELPGSITYIVGLIQWEPTSPIRTAILNLPNRNAVVTYYDNPGLVVYESYGS